MPIVLRFIIVSCFLLSVACLGYTQFFYVFAQKYIFMVDLCLYISTRAITLTVLAPVLCAFRVVRRHSNRKSEKWAAARKRFREMFEVVQRRKQYILYTSVGCWAMYAQNALNWIEWFFGYEWRFDLLEFARLAVDCKDGSWYVWKWQDHFFFKLIFNSDS